MPTTNSSLRPAREPESPSTQFVLREAKRLHRAASSDAPSEALPVLRRLLAATAVPTARTLPDLFRLRGTVQRKHVLRALAFEAGHASWESYRQALPHVDAQTLRQAARAERSTAIAKHWFANEDDAQRFAAANGGHVVRVGRQAVVLPAGPVADPAETPE